MSQTFGFFNSLDDDRLYNAETFNRYFEGLVTPIGVFSNVGSLFKCTLDSTDGLHVHIGTGKLLINSHWFKIEGDDVVIDLEPISGANDRIDLIVARWRDNDRRIELDKITGKAKKDPTTPVVTGRSTEIVNGMYYGIDARDGIVEVPLYSIRVSPGSTKLAVVNNYIGTYYTPYVSHIIVGPDKDDIDARLAQIMDGIRYWNSQLQEELQVSTALVSYAISVSGASGMSNSIVLEEKDPEYTYSPGDIFFVYYNGFALYPSDTDPAGYSITNNGNTTTLTIKGSMGKGNFLRVVILKSQVGVPVYEDGTNIAY